MFREPQKQVLGRDELVVEGRCDARRRLKDPHQFRRQIQLERRRNGGVAGGTLDQF